VKRKYLRISEVMETIPVSDATLRRWLRLGLIRSVRIGRIRFVEVADFEKVLAGAKQRQPA